jgi:hypothetical protein
MPVESLPIDPKILSLIDNEDKRETLALELSGRFNAWEGVLDSYNQRWLMNEKLVRNDPERPPDTFWNGFIYRHIPVTSTKGRTWRGFICSAPTTANPYFVGTLFGSNANRASEIEDDFYLFMRKGQWERSFRKSVWNIGIYGKSLTRVRCMMTRKKKPGFTYETISIRRSFVYPDDDTPIEDKLNIGHSYDVRVGTIWDDQDAGKYYADSRPHGEDERRSSKVADGLIQSSDSITIEERNKFKRVVECFDYRDYGLGEKWYRIRFIPDGEPILLAIYEYPYSRPWYFDMFVHEEDERFIPETSRFNDLQDIQLATNEQWNLMNAGTQMAAFPTTFAAGWAPSKKHSRTRPGAIEPILQGGSVTSIQSKYDPGVAPLLLQDLDNRGDAAIQMSAQAQGGEASYDKTATGAQIRKLGTDQAVNEDLSNIDVSIREQAEFMQELYRYHFEEFKAAYGDKLSVKSPDVLDEEITWELNGKSPTNTPQAQADAAMALSQMLLMFTPESIQIMLMAGVNWRELLQSMVRNSTLDNKQKILLSDEEVQNAILQSQILQSAAQSGSAGPMAQNPGMGMVQGQDGGAGAGGA